MCNYIKKDEILKSIDYLEGLPCGSPIQAYELVKTTIEDMSFIDADNKWILCSEKLPHEYKNVIVTWKYGNERHTTVAFLRTKDAVTFWDSDSMKNYVPLNVIAWMPLPEPYKTNQEEVVYDL